MATNSPVTTIQLEIKVRRSLQALGKKGETYNDILKRLLKKAAYVDFMEEQYAILDNEICRFAQAGLKPCQVTASEACKA